VPFQTRFEEPNGLASEPSGKGQLIGMAIEPPDSHAKPLGSLYGSEQTAIFGCLVACG